MINNQYKVDVIHGDSSSAQFTISKKFIQNGRSSTATEKVPSTVLRIKFYDQQGYGSDWYVKLKGYGQCQTTVFGPPNVEGRLLMNILAYQE